MSKITFAGFGLINKFFYKKIGLNSLLRNYFQYGDTSGYKGNMYILDIFKWDSLYIITFLDLTPDFMYNMFENLNEMF